MEYLDYHETFPTRWEITASYAICCAKCHETKLAKHFRRKLTRAQAVARGHALGMRNQDDQPRHLKGERLPTVESKYCTKCQPGHYKPTEMSVRELYQAAYDGKVSLTRANIDAERKRQQARRKISTAVSDRWAKWKAAPWTHIRAKLADALTSATHSVNYNRHRKILKDEGVPEILAFYAAYQEALRTIRAQCTINARTEATVEPGTTWAELAGPPAMRHLQALWDAIPAPAKGRMKTVPLLINKARPLVMEGYVAPNQDSIDRRSPAKKE